MAETLVDHGRVTRYDPASGTAVVATSCAALASGCAEGVDPVAFYRRALAASGPLSSSARDTDGRRVFRVALPVQTLADSVRIVQVATIDAATYLPRRIEWRQVLAGGRERTFAEIVVRDIARANVSTEPPSVFDLQLPPETAVTQVTAPGVPVRRLAERRLTVAEARALDPSPWWFGRAYRGRRLSEIALVRYTGGTAVRIRYGPTTIWTYGRVIPPPLLGAQVPRKDDPPRAERLGAVLRDRGRHPGRRAVDPRRERSRWRRPRTLDVHGARRGAAGELAVASARWRRAASTWSPPACAPTRPT